MLTETAHGSALTIKDPDTGKSLYLGKVPSKKRKYLFYRTHPKEPVALMPEGYEIVKYVNGVVTLRKIATMDD